MIPRAVALVLLAFVLAGVDGFATLPHQSFTLLPNGAPGAAPSARPRTPLPVLQMSDMPFGEISRSNSNNKESSSRTQLQAVEAAYATDLEAATADLGSNFADLMVEPARNWSDQMAQKIRAVDINEVINTSIVIALAVTILAKLTMVDAGMTRGWTSEEVMERMAADNWSAYLHVLRANPIATKAVTSATVYAIGDTIAQRTEGQSMGSLDRPRIVRSALAGFIGHGPMSHFWYQISENFFDNVVQLTQWWSFIPKVVVDQTVWGPIWNNSYILFLGLMKMESPATIWGDMKRCTIPLVLSGLKLWPLAHCVTYGLIPVENRLLWVDMVEILWVTILASQAAGHGGESQSQAQTVADNAEKPVLATNTGPSER